MRVIVIGLLFLSLAGCSLIRPFGGEGVSATALPFDAKLARGEDPRDVSVTVKAASAGVEDVRESVRFPVTRYCLSTFGASAADWTVDPVTGDWAFVRDGESMVFTARCTAR